MSTPLVGLRSKIESKQAHLGVIGLGYVGLTVACAFAEVGFDVLGVELREDRVAMVNAGISPIDGNEPGIAELLRRVVDSGKLRATAQYSQLGDRDVVLICVETPVDEHHVPRYDSLHSVLTGLGPVVESGALVVVESTISPGTMDGLVRPVLEESSGRRVNDSILLGHCPERVMPGKLLANLHTIGRVVGGMTPATGEVMAALYRHVVQGDLDIVDCVTAEVVKTAENAYRDVQIAFANEVALICELVGADAWQVRDLVNKSPGRAMLRPGAGVGGHCIPKDPWLLAYAAGEKWDSPLIRAARFINDTMPYHVVSLLVDALGSVGLALKGSRILVLGYAYLEDSDDTRNSPSEALVARLRELGAHVVVHDPWVRGYEGDVYERARGCDAVVLMVNHSAYGSLNLAALKQSLRQPTLIDGRRVFDAGRANAAGLIYRAVGLGMKQT